MLPTACKPNVEPLGHQRGRRPDPSCSLIALLVLNPAYPLYRSEGGTTIDTAMREHPGRYAFR